MKSVTITLLFVAALVAAPTALSQPVNANEIASCSNPQGQAFFPLRGDNPKNTSGWQKDGIAGGRITLAKAGGDKLDILYVDSRRQMMSVIRDGGKILPIRATENEISVLAVSDEQTEIYTFWRNKEGKLEFSMLQSRGGKATNPKTSIMVGSCDFIIFPNAK